MRILGLDPGLRTLGWGVISTDGVRLAHVASGEIRSGSGEMSARLRFLFDGLQDLIAQYRPDAAAVEQTFVNSNGASTLKLGQARGIALLAPALAGLEVGEYAPNAVKKTVVGVGHADKAQVAHMVQMQLPGCAKGGPDAMDALAIAICHSVHLRATREREVAR